MNHELGFPAGRRGGWIVVTLAALALGASPVAAQGRLARASAPAMVRVTTSKRGAAVTDSAIVTLAPDSVSVAESTDAGADDDDLGVDAGIVTVDRFGHEVHDVHAEPAVPKPAEAPNDAKMGSAARPPAQGEMTPLSRRAASQSPSS